MTRRQSSDVRMARQDAPQPPMAMQVTILHIARTAGARRPRGPQKVVVAAVTAASGAAARACATNEPQASNCCECAKERAGSGYGHRCTTRKFQEVFSRQELRIHGTLAPGGYSSCCARLRWQHHHASGSLQVTCIGSCNDKANSSDGLKKRTEHNREPRQARNAAAITTRVGKGTNSKQKTTSRIWPKEGEIQNASARNIWAQSICEETRNHCPR